MSQTTLCDGRIIVEVGDITSKKVDAIVNAANSSLLGGGGVDGAIHRKGGPVILESCREIRRKKYGKGLPTGEAVATAGGNLPAEFVIHTVGPVWQGGAEREDELLVNCYTNSLKIARELKLDTIAFPAISTGIYGFPGSRAAALVFKTIKNFLESSQNPSFISLIFYTEKDYHCFLNNYNRD